MPSTGKDHWQAGGTQTESQVTPGSRYSDITSSLASRQPRTSFENTFCYEGVLKQTCLCPAWAKLITDIRHLYQLHVLAHCMETLEKKTFCHHNVLSGSIYFVLIFQE